MSTRIAQSDWRSPEVMNRMIGIDSVCSGIVKKANQLSAQAMKRIVVGITIASRSPVKRWKKPAMTAPISGRMRMAVYMPA